VQKNFAQWWDKGKGQEEFKAWEGTEQRTKAIRQGKQRGDLKHERWLVGSDDSWVGELLPFEAEQ
jgi:hypothetical protein